jgi:hypothetical protein
MTQETKFDLESIFENLESIEMIDNTKELLDNGAYLHTLRILVWQMES